MLLLAGPVESGPPFNVSRIEVSLPVFGQRLGVLDVAVDNGPDEFGSFISVGDGQVNSLANRSKPRLLGKAVRALIEVSEPLRGILKLEGRHVKIIVKFGRQKIGFVFEHGQHEIVVALRIYADRGRNAADEIFR